MAQSPQVNYLRPIVTGTLGKWQKDVPYVNIHFENLIDSEQHPEKVVSLDLLKAAGFKRPGLESSG